MESHLWLRCFDIIYSFVGESMHDDSTVVFAYYKEGATNPTFLYFGHGLKEVKCWLREALVWSVAATLLSLCLFILLCVSSPPFYFSFYFSSLLQDSQVINPKTMVC